MDDQAVTENCDSPVGDPGPSGAGRLIAIPELCLVALVGPSGCGKSTFARQHFAATEVLSSDTLRAWVSDDELDQSATTDAFDVLHYIAAKRLDRGKIVVVDATNVQFDARKALVQLAKTHNVLAVAIVFNIPERICQDRNASRTDRQVPPRAIRRHCYELKRSIPSIPKEGFRYSFVVTLEQMNAVKIERTKLWTDRREDHGPFDIVGDIHGCAEELRDLLGKLGYIEDEKSGSYRHPEGRRAFFVGDLVDRGPGVVEALDIVRKMVQTSSALCVPGNHDEKFLRWLKGKRVTLTHGLADTVSQVESLPEAAKRNWKEDTKTFLDRLVSHFVLDDGRLVVSHAGLIEKMQGRASGAVREFCLYGDITGEVNSEGLPVRRDWAANYSGAEAVVYGHTPQTSAQWINNTVNIDTGCVFGGSLTALRWPEREIVSIRSKKKYAEPSRAFLTEDDTLAAIQSSSLAKYDLMLTDVVEGGAIGSDSPTFGGSRRVQTRLAGSVSVLPQNGAAALELMSRFAVDPRWLVYLPPTMSPCETEPPGEPYLEHPRGAFNYYWKTGVTDLICEEKHMGSRAVIIVCRNAEVAQIRFGLPYGTIAGECYTRTGRRFFHESIHALFIERVREALECSSFWNRLSTDWAVIDCEVLPWNAKAQGLLREQYAPVGAAASAALVEARSLVSLADARGISVASDDLGQREDAIKRYIDAYRAYCWKTEGLEGISIAPFHLLATEGSVHVDKKHDWHLAALSLLAEADPSLFRKTDSIAVDLMTESSVKAATEWWHSKTDATAEGMVVKPQSFIARNGTRSVQPAVKRRGREYLRIIYGPEYAIPKNLEGLRQRNLGRKRSLAEREFALGIEGLERFVAAEPLHRVHECAFAVLALESEPVDPRL